MLVICIVRDMPIAARLWAGRRVISTPSKTIRPAEGRRIPVRMLKYVVLPAPFGPMMARHSPTNTLRLTSVSAFTPSKCLATPTVSSMTAAACSSYNGTGPFAM